ncbi:ribose-phosphate pyrophosphokinase 1-like [Camellia sinensis]|uniref:ribose-phosphate pyrophosphokinase 1-like n=1 Tax=Camellia sinensis TaxID=4442 RepID=UPI0010362DA0|nr:ribose-phosphate pyrophosphokinase 1-like [Camellia sinensis]
MSIILNAIVQVMNLIGDVKGKVAVMVDDMIDTAGTIAKGAALLHEEGAREVYACSTHAVFRTVTKDHRQKYISTHYTTSRMVGGVIKL